MATTYRTLMDGAPWKRGRKRQARGRPLRERLRERLRVLFRTGARILLGTAVIALALALAAALFSYDPADPSFNSATARATTNLVGPPGAHVADLLLQGLGFAAFLPVPFALLTGLRLCAGVAIPHFRRGLLLTLAAMLLAAAAAGLFWPSPVGELDAGAGGILGLLLAKAVAGLPWPAGIDPALGAVALGGLLALGALGGLLWGINPRRAEFAWLAGLVPTRGRGGDEIYGETPEEVSGSWQRESHGNPLPPPGATSMIYCEKVSAKPESGRAMTQQRVSFQKGRKLVTMSCITPLGITA